MACKELLGLVDTVNEQIVICAILLNVLYGQVNQHTGDLRSKVGSNNFCYEFKDSATDGILIAGVDWNDSSIDWKGLLI